jgi:signal transduction histidine kinase
LGCLKIRTRHRHPSGSNADCIASQVKGPTLIAFHTAGDGFPRISEALTNIARHSGAHTAQIHAWVSDATLTVTVVDDGHGGADPARGTGLAGLAARVDAIDGTLDITSPPGGPTEVRMICPIADY